MGGDADSKARFAERNHRAKRQFNLGPCRTELDEAIAHLASRARVLTKWGNLLLQQDHYLQLLRSDPVTVAGLAQAQHWWHCRHG